VSDIVYKKADRWLLMPAALCAIGPISIDMYLPAGPAMARDLGYDGQSVQWSITNYLLGLVVGQLFFGPLSDRIGRKPPLYAGLTLYVLASIACMSTKNGELLGFLRFFQGFGGCVGMVIARAVIRDRTDTRGTARALSLIMLAVSAAPLVAPFVGATLSHYWGWRSTFAVMAFLGSCCLLATYFVMGETRELPNTNLRIRWFAVLNTYLNLLYDRRFVMYTLCNGLAQGSMYVYIAGSAFVLVERYGIKPGDFSIFFAGNSLGMIAASQVNVRLLTRMTPDYLLGKALWLLVGVGVVACLVSEQPHLEFLAIIFFLFITSLGVIAPNAAALALEEQADNTATASALMGTILIAVGALCSSTVVFLPRGSAHPLLVVMATCAFGAALVHASAKWLT